MAAVDEIADNIFRINLAPPDRPVTFSMFLVRADEPTLIETSYGWFFDETREAIAKLVDPTKIRQIVVPHFEADETKLRWWRQTPGCMVELGKLHPGLAADDNTYWGSTIEGSTVIRRSAIGVSEDGRVLYVGIGDSTTAPAIARAMKHAGAHSIAQLDVNWSYPKFLLYEPIDDGRIVRIMLNRPDARNAQNRGLLVELNEAFLRAEADDEVRVVILGGTGPMFSSGHDLGSKASVEEMTPGPTLHPSRTINGGTRKGAEALMLQEWHYFFENTRRWRNLRKITVAQVHGPVYAAGLMLMWSCDLIVGADDVVFADVVGTRLGMCGLEYFAHPWELGPRKAKELLLTGDSIDVHEAHRLGMVSKVDYYAVYDENAPATEVPVTLSALGNEVKLTPVLGAGGNFFLNQTVALKLDMRMAFFVDNVPDYQPDEQNITDSHKRLYNQFVASGVYFYSVEGPNGETKTGKFTVVQFAR